LSKRRVGFGQVCPIGFVADHLEVLYDIDVEARPGANRRGIELRCTVSFNGRSAVIKALAAIVIDTGGSGASRDARATRP